MYRTPVRAYDRDCDCQCPAHRGQPRSTDNDPACRCLTICTSQPMTLLAPQINAAVFLDRPDELWYVPGVEPGHWDLHNAALVGAGHPLAETGDRITDLLCETHEGLLRLVHRL
jgi:hypothetical protein